MKTNHHIIQWLGLLARNQVIPRHLALSALLLGLFWPGFAGATDFVSLHDGSWFDAPNTWGQSFSPGFGDDVEITTNVNFDSSTIAQSVTVSNLTLYNGTLSVSGPATLTMAGTDSLFTGNNFINGIGGVLHNQGMVFHTDDGTLNIGYGSTFENQMGGIYNLEADGGFFSDGNSSFNNYGLLRKSGGNGISSFGFNSGVTFNNLNGVIEVDSGTLSLNSDGSSASGTFIVASGAVLDLTGGRGPTWGGVVSGSGAGTVSLGSGTINTGSGLTLNLPAGLFQWTGGTLAGTTINSNVVSVAGSGSVGLGGVFYNHGFVNHTNTATLHIGYGATFENSAGGTYNLEGDGGFFSDGNSSFNNSGLLRKSGGNGTSGFGANSGIAFNNLNGVIEVDSGTLSLNSNGSSSNGTFSVASGAVLDLTGGRGPTWGGVVGGGGAGTVSLGSGTINSSPSLTLNLPGGLFQWTGGSFSGTTINSNVVSVAGSGSVGLGGVFYNSGLVHHTNTATLHIGIGATFENQAGGSYNLEGDGGFFSDGNGHFNNSGLLRKSGGNGISSFGINGGVAFNNLNGSIEVDSGQLSLNGHSYAQGSGSFIVTLGGTNAGQSGQLLCGAATLGGPLQVKLASGYVPVLGNQFQILSSSSRSGTFTALNVPGGISVNYSNNGVFLVVTGTVPVQIINPVLSGSNFAFSFGTVSNQSYTVQRNDDLNTANWTFYTNLTGNGSLMQVVAPVTNAPMRFFRVREP